MKSGAEKILSGHGHTVRLVPPSEGHKPKNARAAAAVHQLGRKTVTGNFKRIAETKGKAAAISAFQNARRAAGK